VAIVIADWAPHLDIAAAAQPDVPKPVITRIWIAGINAFI
jgi:hypothetical protein